ncbi:TRAP transporter small permease subunit [Bacillus sp. EB106-08-02-XG196]|uniref:TRAP transporter small permease n=1 Tax=Bacillus sp. EB106-08-02-XG196 TaxID=2737049 RepID=UPI0015C425CA|nr:TRAP transporter small permease subunit [Bacillus sp. EB106-08-02-XG196]NWQ42569.1 TRAP transporter small permease subunit [Bacillus sp. EB106-08-02-XG196]
MDYILKFIQFITNINKWIAYFTLVVMMVAVTFFSISRSSGQPVIGDIELVQFTMVILIMGSLAITEQSNSHISIGLIVDKFSPRIQAAINCISQLLTLLFCFLVCWVFISKMNFIQTSDLLKIPFYPVKILLIIGFIGWGLEAILRLYKSIRSF